MMILVLIIIALIILPNFIDYLKIGAVLSIEILKFIVTFGMFPLMVYLIIILNMKGYL